MQSVATPLCGEQYSFRRISVVPLRTAEPSEFFSMKDRPMRNKPFLSSPKVLAVAQHGVRPFGTQFPADLGVKPNSAREM